MKRLFPSFLVFLLIASCSQKSKSVGSIEVIDPELNALLDKNAQVEIIAEGFDWSEGPLWVKKDKMLLFSDVPKNTIYKWTEEKGKEVYLTPSGYTSSVPRGGETGSNGLALTADGKLVLTQCGDRRIAVMNAPTDSPKPDFTSIADNYQGKKFNSPNDLVVRSNGDVFFTDPAYGLEKDMDDPKKEIPFQGVYKASAGGQVTLLVDSITRPNGIVLTNNEKTLIIANSDESGHKRIWYEYDLGNNDSLINPRIYRDVSDEKESGSPDGFKINSKGIMFATGPGGLWIFNPSGKLIGKIKCSVPTSNCAFSDDEKNLFITADMYVLRVKLK